MPFYLRQKGDFYDPLSPFLFGRLGALPVLEIF
jgi:hypothetical protein